MSQTAVSRIWRAFWLKPHLFEQFRLSPDPQFIDKVRDVAGLYLKPARSGRRALRGREDPDPGARPHRADAAVVPGVPRRQTHGYVRHRATNLYAALNIASGHVIADLTPRHRAREFRGFLDLIDEQVPNDLAVHVVLDNVAFHLTAEIQRWLHGHPRFTFHFTPTYSSWMNLVKRWFAELTTKWLRRGAHCTMADLTSAVERWVGGLNENPRPCVWH
ncbi:MAG: IS630 family transposase [Chloroflexi bacterium]|nr:IS630 family transposase [Chloroflexota bacterium]